MDATPKRSVRALLTAALATLPLGCASITGGDNGVPSRAPVVLGQHGPNAVSVWDAVAVATAGMPPAPGGATPEERRPGPDVATVHVAMHDAIVAVSGGHRPFAVRARTPAAGASAEAAANEAAYRVLLGLFPSRADKYRPTYEQAMAAIPEGDAKARGGAVGAEVAAKVLALRANDGRMADLAPYVPGSGVGQFRGSNPINRLGPLIRPFVVDFASVKLPGPPALTSAGYARDLAEVAAYGGSQSAQRSADQLEVARFHTEAPGTLWPRNLRRFATSQPTLVENARLMTRIWVSYQDAVGACFAAKYRYQFWRPLNAIGEADRDDNPATTADPAWTPVLPTPNHPEYPAAHGCASGAVAEAIALYFGTPLVAFEFDSTASPKRHAYASTAELVAEIENARVWGGMHYRQSVVDGAMLGREVARRVAERFADGAAAE